MTQQADRQITEACDDMGGLREVDEHTRELWERAEEDWVWIIHRPELLESYRGEYVVIWNKQIIAHGADPRAVRAQTEATPYWHEPFLSFRVPTREESESILIL